MSALIFQPVYSTTLIRQTCNTMTVSLTSCCVITVLLQCIIILISSIYGLKIDFKPTLKLNICTDWFSSHILNTFCTFNKGCVLICRGVQSEEAKFAYCSRVFWGALTGSWWFGWLTSSGCIEISSLLGLFCDGVFRVFSSDCASRNTRNDVYIFAKDKRSPWLVHFMSFIEQIISPTKRWGHEKLGNTHSVPPHGNL